MSWGWLYRCIRIEAPVEVELLYNGRSFTEYVQLDGKLAIRRFAWFWFIPRFDFEIATTEGPLPVVVEIRFWPWLMIRAFRLQMGGKVVYSEGRR